MDSGVSKARISSLFLEHLFADYASKSSIFTPQCFNIIKTII